MQAPLLMESGRDLCLWSYFQSSRSKINSLFTSLCHWHKAAQNGYLTPCLCFVSYQQNTYIDQPSLLYSFICNNVPIDDMTQRINERTYTKQTFLLGCNTPKLFVQAVVTSLSLGPLVYSHNKMDMPTHVVRYLHFSSLAIAINFIHSKLKNFK